MASENRVSSLRECWLAGESSDSAPDYKLLSDQGKAFAARSRDGSLALVMPLTELGPAPMGRSAAGCELVYHSLLQFSYRGRHWEGAAAVLVCSDPGLVNAFAVLADDVLTRTADAFSWSSIVAVVEEWQTLLMPRGRPTKESELGVWGELWFVEQSRHVDRTLSGWRGPEGDPSDFFCDGVAVEVKASRTARQHFVSQSQIDTPAGIHDSWLLSLWVKMDPVSGLTVPQLAERILARAKDPSGALRCIARAGYSPVDRCDYTSAYVLLSDPEWFATSAVPRIRVADPGISHLRYRVALDRALRADEATAERLQRHFHERTHGSNQ